VRTEGEEFLRELFLQEYLSGSPPILISDGFPSGFLPRPLSGMLSRPEAARSRDERLRDYEIRKTRSGTYLTFDEFQQALEGKSVLPRSSSDIENRVVSRNQIDRLTNTTGGAGGRLYDFEELCLSSVDVYWRIAEGYEKLFEDFRQDLHRTGYGKRKSVGYGTIHSISKEPFDGFAPPDGANAFVSLSHFVPSAKDPTEGFWTIRVKYGKLGEEGAVSGHPFKRPLIQLAAGSCFYDSPPREWYGRMVKGLAADPKVLHYGYAFAVPMVLNV
jgi:CRISPR-associated protein Csm4